MKLTLYHGTSSKIAKKIEKEGFVTDKNYNWDVKSKKGLVYLSSAYAPFYAMKHDTNDLAIVKVEVDSEDLYAEDDFIMRILGKPVYTQKELDRVGFITFKRFWKESLKYIGNVAIRPSKIRILGITHFNSKNLIFKCDPVISPMNFKIMGDYYNALTEWIFKGKPIKEFKTQTEFLTGLSQEELQKQFEKLKVKKK